MTQDDPIDVTQVDCRFIIYPLKQLKYLKMSFYDVENPSSAPTRGARAGRPVAQISKPSAQPRVASPITSSFEEDAASLSSQLTKIAKNLNELEKLVAILGNKTKDTHEHRDKLNKLLESLTVLVRESGQSMKKLQSAAIGTNDKNKLKANVLSKECETSIKRYAELARTAAQKQRESMAVEKQKVANAENQRADLNKSLGGRASPMGNKAAALDEEDAANERTSLIAAQKAQQQLMNLESEIQHNERVIAEREDGIREIEASIREVNDIFRDLGTMVAEQGEQIERIDEYVSSAVNHTSKAGGELSQANEYQKKSRTKMCIILAILVGVGVVIAFFLKVI